MIDSTTRLALVGATGAVGNQFLRLLEERGTEPKEIRALASARSAGKTIPFSDGSLRVAEANPEAFAGLDVAIFCSSGTHSKELAPAAVAAGCPVVDNSSAFRLSEGVPLVVPEVNRAELESGRDAWRNDGTAGIIANPNCSTIILLLALAPLHERFGVSRAVVSTYQAASGAGAAAMEELRAQVRTVLDGGDPEPRIFKEPCAFNVFSHDSDIDPETGDNVEEAKMLSETRKILGDPDLQITTTCIRVPALRAHAESVNVALKTPATEDEIRALLEASAGVAVVDDRKANSFPTSLKASGQDRVLVGRIRADRTLGHDDDSRWHGFNLFIAGDQIRKGAATNALQIADVLLG